MADNPQTTALSDPQDPLPESNWLWRRVFIFGISMVLVYLLYGTVDRLGKIAVVQPEVGIPAFVAVVKLLILTLNAVILYYMVAPSAEQITKLVKTASLLKSGVQVASRAIIRTPGKTEETQATVGLPPQPIVPPASPSTVAEDSAAAASEATSDDEEDFAPRSRT